MIQHIDRTYMLELVAPTMKRKRLSRLQRFLAQTNEPTTPPPYVITLPAANAIITHRLTPHKVSNELRRFLNLAMNGGIHEFLNSVMEYARDPRNGGYVGCEGMAFQTKSTRVGDWDKPPANRQAVFYMPRISTERIIIEWWTSTPRIDGKALDAQPYTGQPASHQPATLQLRPSSHQPASQPAQPYRRPA